MYAAPVARQTIRDIARFAANLKFSDVPARVVNRARWQQASVLAASFAGLHDHGARTVLELARRTGGSGPARVFAGGFLTSRPAAVLANAAVSCTFDFDEILLLGHPGHSTVTVPLMLGEELGATWADVVTAQVAGNEVAGRLGLATVLGPQNGQMLPYLHCAAAAVCAGKLLGLDEERMAHALAVALAQPPAALWPSFLGALDVKVLIAAHGASMGVTAAMLAEGGFTGALDLLDHPRGFFHRFAFAPIRRALTGFGRAWLSDTLQVKLHAACWYYQSLYDTLTDEVHALERRRGRPLEASEVRSVRCRVTYLGHAVDAAERARPRDRLTANEANFSIATGTALAALLGRLIPEDLGNEALARRETAVRTIASRVRVEHDAALTRRLLGALDQHIGLADLLGDLSLRELAAAGRALKDEFPSVGGVRGRDVLPSMSGLMAAFGSKLFGGARQDFELGDLSGLLLPIPGGFDLELTDGTRLSGERDVEDGALGLSGAPGRVAAKLRASATARLGAGGAAALVAVLEKIGPASPVRELTAATQGES